MARVHLVNSPNGELHDPEAINLLEIIGPRQTQLLLKKAFAAIASN